MFMPMDPALPGSPDWDAGRHLDALRAQADLGRFLSASLIGFDQPFNHNFRRNHLGSMNLWD